ncbi:MAG: GNAT family N-acetyltransferase [Anaerolineae bacterium]|nr:GNAT family N-acetyltransferase [Candidatus Roseilinea sp.]MDW8450342.1 GNAT family N-acetyltransferase [Anaerolineae bacterium]
MPTLGSQIVPAKMLELRRLLAQLDAGDVGALDESLGEWMHRPLGREALASVVFPVAGSTYLCMLNFEPAGLMLIERGNVGARIRLLAVAPDLRRRGLARTMLEAAEDLVRQAGLRWIWMTVPSDNLPATRCALACGYRRYRPQFMRRQLGHALPVRVERARVEPLAGQEADEQLYRWLGVAANQGDAWCSDLARSDLLAWNTAALDDGQLYLLISPPDEVGVAHLRGEPAHRIVTLWLDQAVWNTPREMQVLKAVMDSEADAPPTLDVEFGSGGHLRAAAPAYKALGFRPVLRDRVVMAKRVG